MAKKTSSPEKELPKNSKEFFKKKRCNPHDLFFRKVMQYTEVVLEFIQKYIPFDVAENIDQESLQLIDGSFIDGFFHETRTDIIYKAKIKFEGKTPSKQKEGHVYFLIEHQRKIDSLMPLRMQRYALSIIERHLQEHKKNKYPVVYATVIYNGKRAYSAESNFLKCFEHPELAKEAVLNFFKLINLPKIPDDKLKQNFPLIDFMEMVLKHVDTPNPVKFFERIKELVPEAAARNLDMVDAAVHYVFETNKEGFSKFELLEEIKKHTTPTTQKAFMTLAQLFIEEGKKEGLQEGLQTGLQTGLEKGLKKGQSSLLSKLLNHRFPRAVTKKYLELINNADGETLSMWGERLMDATSIEEVFSGRPLRG